VSEQTMARPGAGADPADEGRPASQATTPVPPTPARPVVSIALVMFVPAVVLVLDGNLSVQTALMRFAAALLVSWVAARLVWATVQSARAAGVQAGGDGPGGDGPGGAGPGGARPGGARPGGAGPGATSAAAPPAGPAT